MRQLVLIIALAALAFFGWDYYKKHEGEIKLPWLSDNETPANEKSPAGALRPVNDDPVAPPVPLAPQQQFQSKIALPDVPEGQNLTAPPGYVYITERVSTATNAGVIALVPGDLVKVLQRKPNGTIKVTNDSAVFEVKESQTTRDPREAQEAERRAFESRTLRR
ncbi:MAG: hypothetical protein ABI680_01235 [Chthoniobacteraceae bacterium]